MTPKPDKVALVGTVGRHTRRGYWNILPAILSQTSDMENTKPSRLDADLDQGRSFSKYFSRHSLVNHEIGLYFICLFVCPTQIALIIAIVVDQHLVLVQYMHHTAHTATILISIEGN